jgi:hypothetical protein
VWHGAVGLAPDTGDLIGFYRHMAAVSVAMMDVQRDSSFIDNLLVRLHSIIVMISVDRPCAMGVLNSLFQIALYLPSWGLMDVHAVSHVSLCHTQVRRLFIS